MARRKTHPLYQSVPPRLEVSSLIDICFLLLIYFLVTSTLVPSENDLKMRLPVPVDDSAVKSIISPMLIGVNSQGAVSTGVGSSRQVLDIDVAERSLPLLASQLDLYARAARASGWIPLVQIHVEGGATQQRVIDVLNALAMARIHEVAFTDLIEM